MLNFVYEPTVLECSVGSRFKINQLKTGPNLQFVLEQLPVKSYPEKNGRLAGFLCIRYKGSKVFRVPGCARMV
jgi:hypothetical protein